MATCELGDRHLTQSSVLLPFFECRVFNEMQQVIRHLQHATHVAVAESSHRMRAWIADQLPKSFEKLVNVRHVAALRDLGHVRAGVRDLQLIADTVFENPRGLVDHDVDIALAEFFERRAVVLRRIAFDVAFQFGQFRVEGALLDRPTIVEPVCEPALCGEFQHVGLPSRNPFVKIRAPEFQRAFGQTVPGFPDSSCVTIIVQQMRQYSVRHVADFDPVVDQFGDAALVNRDLIFQQHPDGAGEVVDPRTAAVARPGADDSESVVSVPIAEDQLVVDHVPASSAVMPIIGVFVGHHRHGRWWQGARNVANYRRHLMRGVGPHEIGRSAERGTYGGVEGLLAGEDVSRIR